MAQKSKKEFIIACARPLFLEYGFKGTSIDLVVKQSGVSKPTVYNHFPDKAALILAVLQRWIEDNKPLIPPLKNFQALQEFAARQWLSDEAVGFYALVIGEGRRFPLAKRLFWEQFDDLWRKALLYLAAQLPDVDKSAEELQLDRHLFLRLKQL